MPDSYLQLKDDTIVLLGTWDIDHHQDIHQQIIQANTDSVVKLDGNGIDQLDFAGALLLSQLLEKLDLDEDALNLSAEQLVLLEQIVPHTKEESTAIKIPSMAAKVGNFIFHKYRNTVLLLTFIGAVAHTAASALLRKNKVSFGHILAVIEDVGVNAIPIVSMLSLSIGVVLAYQIGLQLQTYGANVYIAYYSGMAMLREFAPLLTSLIVAGRTASSFTALVGTMKLNEEIDALRTLGISPLERLVIPRIIGALVAVPLLTIVADLFGIIGCMLMSKTMLQVEFFDYIMLFQEYISIADYTVGLVKAPMFAMIIAFVGCFQGLQVGINGNGIGMNTTRSVVQAIFLIIIADATFSIMFGWS